MKVIYFLRGGGPEERPVEADLFEACDSLGVPEAAAQWDASDIAGGAMPKLRRKKIRLYFGQRSRDVDVAGSPKRVDDIMLRLCVGDHQFKNDAKHHRFEWSRSLGWLDINKIEAQAHASAMAKFHKDASESYEKPQRSKP